MRPLVVPPPIGPGLPRFFQMANKTPDEVAQAIKVEDYVDLERLGGYPGSY